MTPLTTTRAAVGNLISSLAWGACVIASASGIVCRGLDAQSAPIGRLPFTRTVLSNGLVAILNEDHSSPIVAVDVWFRIGSRDDPPGRMGVAHFCEHIMAAGSLNLDQPQGTFYRALGGTSPRAALTTEDITHFFFIVPRNQLETALWAEGDRMASPLSRADSQHVAVERGIVAQERLQQIENIPFGVLRELVLSELYPPSHPYHNSGASPMADLPKLTPADLKESCLLYYVPNNAVIALSGDFESASARMWIEKYFGGIPRGAKVNRTPVDAVTLTSERRLVLEDNRVSQPQMRFDWVGVGYADSDRLPLLALASTLSLSRFGLDGHYAATGVQPPMLGRLSRLLVEERQLATQVFADMVDQEKSGIFEIAVFPRPGVSLTVIENLVDSVLTNLLRTPITKEEIARFNSYNAVQALLSLQPKFMRADTLAHDEIFAGDPSAYAKQLRSAEKMTPADVERVVRKYLTASRLVVSMVPAGRLELISKPNLPYKNITPPSSIRRR